MNKTLVGIIIAVVFLVGIIWMAQPSAGQEAVIPLKSNGTLVVEGENNYDFGKISMASGKVSNKFKIKNTSSEAVVINKMYTSCMCTTVTLITNEKQIGPVGMLGHGFVPDINQFINSNTEVIIEVIFDPAAHGPAGVGRIQRVVTLENNAGQPVELTFTAVVTP